MIDIYNFITLNSALGILAVLSVLLLMMIVYSIYLSKQYQEHLKDHIAYSDKLNTFLDEDDASIPDHFFEAGVSHKHKIRIIIRYIQKHCLTEKHPHIERLREFSQSLGATAKLRKWAVGRDQEKAAYGLRLLSELGDESDIEIFKKVLDKTDFHEAIFSASLGLAKFNVTDSIRTILEKLYDVKNPNRDMILSVMSAYDDSAIQPVIDLLDDQDIPAQVKGAMIDFLGVKRSKAAKPRLEEMLKSSTDHELNLHIVEALEKVGDEGSCSIIEPFLKDSDFRVRLKAVNALERLAKDKYIDEVEAMLSDPDLFVRRNAAEAMSRMGAEAVERLKRLTTSDNQDISIITKLILAEHEYGKIRWRFRYGDSIA